MVDHERGEENVNRLGRPTRRQRRCRYAARRVGRISTYGETLDEARAMAADAILGYIACLREEGEPIPESDAAPLPLVDRVSVTAGG